jgi:hypothetical protein
LQQAQKIATKRNFFVLSKKQLARRQLLQPIS